MGSSSSCSFFQRWTRDNSKIERENRCSSNSGQDNPAFTEVLNSHRDLGQDNPAFTEVLNSHRDLGQDNPAFTEVLNSHRDLGQDNPAFTEVLNSHRDLDAYEVSKEVNTHLAEGRQANYTDHRDEPFLQGKHSLTSSGYVSHQATIGRTDDTWKLPNTTVSRRLFMSDVAEKLKHFETEPYNETTKQHKLIRNYSYLRENIYTEDLCDRLIEECIIDIEEKQTILNEASSEGTADVLLQTLLQKPSFQSSGIYERFVKALTPAHSFVVERLNSTEPFQAIETEQIDKEFPYARHCLERKLDSVAEQVDTKTTALKCFEQGGISLMNYLEIFPNFNRRKRAAKTLIQSVIKSHESLYIFINVLKELNCDSTLDIIKHFRPQADYTKEPNITVACQTGEVGTTVLQSTPNGYKLVINMNIPEMVQRLNSSSETTEYILKKAHCEIVKVTKGSVVILLKAYDNCLLQHLQTSEKDHSFLCNILKDLFRGCVQDDFPTGELQIKLTLEENNVPEITDIEDEHSPSACEKLQNRKTFICKELNSNKYTKALQDVGFAIDETKQSMDLSRMGKMRYLMNIVLQDETTCDKFIEIVNRLESPITCERVLWNGKRNEMVKAMLENIEYLLDEVIPSHILQHLNNDILTENDRRKILVSETKDRRASVVVLLKLVFNGNARLVSRLYDALLEAGYVDAADQIRKHCQEKKENLNLKGTKDRPKQIQERDQCEHRYLFKGDFNVRFEEDKTVDFERWETNILSMRLKSPTDMTLHLTPLHDNDETMVEIDVEFEDKVKMAFKCVNKAVIKNEEFVSVEVSTTHTCTIKSSFTQNVISIQRVGGILVLKSRNVSLSLSENARIYSTEIIRRGPETYIRNNTSIAKQPSRLASSSRYRNSLDGMDQTYEQTEADGKDIDRGYHSTETLSIVS